MIAGPCEFTCEFRTLETVHTPIIIVVLHHQWYCSSAVTLKLGIRGVYKTPLQFVGCSVQHERESRTTTQTDRFSTQHGF
jgi:hypothetical protein